MQPFGSIKDYTNTVCEQVRWKKAKPIIATEIENHLIDQRDAYMAEGDKEAEATSKAILQMGDAATIGLELDKSYRSKPQWSLICITFVLMLVGALANLYLYDHGTSLSMVSGFSITHYAWGFALFLLCYYLDFTIFGKNPIKTYFGALIIIGILLLLHILSPSPLYVLRAIFYGIPVSFPFIFALLVYGMRGKGNLGIVQACAGIVPLAIYCIIWEMFSQVFVFFLITIIILCFAIGKGWFGIHKKSGIALALGLTIVPSLIGFFLLILAEPYRLDRFFAVFNPYADPMGSGYVASTIRDILAHSKFFGQGNFPMYIESGKNVLPESGSTNALAFLTHQLGFVFFAGLLVLVLVFAGISLCKILKQKSILGSLIAFSVWTSFFVQTAIYIVVNLGFTVFSSSGIPLFSYQLGQILIFSALFGFMLSVFCTGEIYKDTINRKSNQAAFVSYNNGKLIINLKKQKDA